MNRVKKADLIIIAGLCAVLLGSRVPFLSPGSAYGDADRFCSCLSQGGLIAHPPGYFLFLYTGSLFMPLAGQDPGLSLLIEVLFLGLVAVACFYLIGLIMFNRSVAIISSLFLLVNPYFWHNSEVPVTYVAESAAACVVVLMLIMGMMKKNYGWYFFAGLALGVFAGIRTAALPLMLPLALYAIWRRERNASGFAMTLAVFIAGGVLGGAAWFIPTVVRYGSLMAYLNAVSQQSASGVIVNSVFVGGWMALVHNSVKFGGYIFYSFLIPAVYVLVVRSVRKEKVDRPEGWKLALLAFWVIPASAFYILIFMGPPGYLLGVIPAIYILLGYYGQPDARVLYRSPGYRAALQVPVLAGFIVINSLLFVAVTPVEDNTVTKTYLNAGFFMYSAPALDADYLIYPEFLK